MRSLGFIFILLIVSCSSPKTKIPGDDTEKKIPENESKKEEVVDTAKCLAEWNIESGAYRNVYELDDFYQQMVIHSGDFKNKKGLWFFEPRDLKIDSLTHLLAVDTIDNKLILNAEYFFDFVQENLTQMNDAHVLGSVKPALFKKMRTRQIILFLMRAEIIQTYVHLNAEVCLRKESEYNDEYTAEYYVVYHYCTNDCYDEPYKFSVNVNKKTGVVLVRPIL